MWSTPVNHLRPIIRHAIEAICGKRFPRRVTAPDGSARWQNARGRRFGSLEEAYDA